jgi:hypothetical protein
MRSDFQKQCGAVTIENQTMVGRTPPGGENVSFTESPPNEKAHQMKKPTR